MGKSQEEIEPLLRTTGMRYKREEARVLDEALDSISPCVSNYQAIFIPMSGRGGWPLQVSPSERISGGTIEGPCEKALIDRGKWQRPHRSRTHRHRRVWRRSILGLAGAHNINLIWSAGPHMLSVIMRFSFPPPIPLGLRSRRVPAHAPTARLLK